MASDNLDGSSAGLRNLQITDTPPSSQWGYGDGKKLNNNDTSLTLEFTSLSPCKLIRVAGKGEVVEKVWHSLGDYR